MDIRPARHEEFDALGRLTLEAYRTVGDWSADYEAELVDVGHRAEHACVTRRSTGVPEPDVALLGFRLAL